MLARRQFLIRSSLGAASFGLLDAAQAQSASPDGPLPARFGQAPLLQPLRGYVDGLDRVSEGLRVRGRLPAGLRGTLYRNGPGMLERGGQRYRHWFDGDGLVQAWQFGEQGVSHQARFVQTRKFQAEQAAGAFLLPAFGTAIPPKLPVRGPDDMNTANTSVVVQGGRLYALWEGGSATELDPATLRTLGPRTWAPELKGVPFSAHPKKEADGTLWNFGSFGKHLVIYQIGVDGELKRHQVLNLPTGAMLHDFAVSQRYIALLLPPLSLDLAAARSGRSMVSAMRWDAQQPMRLVVIDKATLQVQRTMELPPALVFHFGNAWDEGEQLHLDYVESDIGAFLDGSFNAALGGEQLDGHGKPSQLRLLRADLRSGKITVEGRRESMEFPVVDPRVVARRHRYLYHPLQTGPQDRWNFNAIQRLDLERGRVDRHDFGPHVAVEEHLLVPKPGSRREGEGWLVGTGFDAQRQRSFAAVFDAEAISAGPLALVDLPYWVPFGFHSHFA